MKVVSRDKATVLAVLLLLTLSCNAPVSLFKNESPYERYSRQLNDAGLATSSLYKSWKEAGRAGFEGAQEIDVPFEEAGLFSASKPRAATFRFSVTEGEQLRVEVMTRSVESSLVFVDLFQLKPDSTWNTRPVKSADTQRNVVQLNADRSGEYLLRIQPELLSDVAYRLRITASGSMSFPVDSSVQSNIGSFFGDGREAGARRHEGVDVFAARLSPAVAAADGRVSRVGTNRLGGKVVWLKPEGSPYRLYYAHLDSQLVQAGTAVSIGDTLGLVGNTGNARTTPPHLHFGIYGADGAVDPLPFLRPGKERPAPVRADTTRLGGYYYRKTAEGMVPVEVESAYQQNYRVVLPDGTKLQLRQNQLSRSPGISRTIKVVSETPLYFAPDTKAMLFRTLPADTTVSVTAAFNTFYWLEGSEEWIQNTL